MNTRTNRPISDNEKKLGLATEFGQTEVIRCLVVDERVDINAMVTSSGKTALQIALETNQLSSFKFLLQLGANPVQPCLDGLDVTPLHLAAAMGDGKYIDELMTAKVDPNVMMSNGMTPLFFAAKHGRGLNTALLIKHGASLFRSSANGDSPLSLAVEKGHQGTINAIVNAMKGKHGADTLLKLFKFNDYLRHSFENATSEDAVKSLFELIDVLLKAKVSSNDIQSLLPDRAASSAALNLLIQKQLDTRLIKAAESRDTSSVKTLVACGANVFRPDPMLAYNQSAFDIAMKKESEMLNTMLDSEHVNTPEFQEQLWFSMIKCASQQMPSATLDLIVSKILSPEFNLAAIAANTDNLRYFRGIFNSLASNDNSAKTLLSIYKIYKKLEALDISREHLKLMLPDNDSSLGKNFATTLKEFLLQEIKLLPPQQRLEMCLAAENHDDLLGHVMQMQRGAQKCRPGHGILKAIAEVKAGALAQGAKIPDASKPLAVTLAHDNEALVTQIKAFLANLKPLKLPDIKTILASLAQPVNATPSPQTSDLTISELNARLFEAARFDNAASVQTLIAQDAEVNAYHEPYGQTALDCAAAYGSLNAMRALIAAGADVNLGRRDNQTQTPLHFAAQYGQTKVAAVLLENKADANIINLASHSPLTLAIEDNNKELVELLLKHDASPYRVSASIRDPLYKAAAAHTGILEVVVHHIISKDMTGADIEALSRNYRLSHCFDANKEPGQKRDLLFKIIEKLVLQKVNLNVIKKMIPDNLTLPHKYKGLMPITAIQQAIKNDDMATIILLALRPDNAMIINPENNSYYNPLRVAIDNGKLAAAGLLIALGASPATTIERNNNFTIGYGYSYSASMLMHACLCSSTEMTQLLLDNGADAFFVNRSVSALAVAAAEKRLNIVKLLVDRLLATNDPTKILEILSKENNFRFAISHAGNKEVFAELYRVVDYLLEQRVDYSVIKALLPGTNALWKKAKQNTVDYINPEFKNFSMERIKALPAFERIQACNQAMDSNHPLGHIMFMARGSIRCKLGHGMLKEIADLRDAAILEHQQQLVKLNDDLHDAASAGDLDKVAALIKQGANVNAETSKALQKPLIIAAYEGKKDVVELLLKHGADVNAAITKGKDIQIGARALFAATENGHIDIVNILLERGAYINAVTSKLNTTPLFRAASNGNAELVSLLLSKGGNPRIITNGENKSPLTSAVDHNHTEVASLLADHLLKSFSSAEILEFMQLEKQLQFAFTKAKSASAALVLMRIVGHLLNHSVSIDTIKAMLPTSDVEMEKHDADNVVAQALIHMFKNPELFTAEKVNELISASTDAELISRAQAQLPVKEEVKSEPPAPVAAIAVEKIAEPATAPLDATPHMYPKFSDFGISQESVAAAKTVNFPMPAPLVSKPIVENVNHAIAAQQSVFDLLFGNHDAPSTLAAPPLVPTPASHTYSQAYSLNNGTLFSLDQPAVSTEIRRDPVLESQLAQLEEVFATTDETRVEEPDTVATAVAAMTEAEVEEELAKLDSIFNRTSPTMFRAQDTKQDEEQPTKQKNATQTKHTKQAVLL